MSTDEEPPGEPPTQVIRGETAVARCTALPATIMMRAHLWIHWAKIAIRQERRAWEVRAHGTQKEDFASYIGRETEEAIEAVAAVRHCIHNLYRVWRDDLGLSQEEDIRLHHFTTGTPANEQAWAKRVKDLIGDRNDAVHHDEETAPTQPHPGYPTNVSNTAAVFTAERATEAVDIMLEDVLRLALAAPSQALQQFAEGNGHVLPYLDRQRATGRRSLVAMTARRGADLEHSRRCVFVHSIW